MWHYLFITINNTIIASIHPIVSIILILRRCLNHRGKTTYHSHSDSEKASKVINATPATQKATPQLVPIRSPHRKLRYIMTAYSIVNTVKLKIFLFNTFSLQSNSHLVHHLSSTLRTVVIRFHHTVLRRNLPVTFLTLPKMFGLCSLGDNAAVPGTWHSLCICHI